VGGFRELRDDTSALPPQGAHRVGRECSGAKEAASVLAHWPSRPSAWHHPLGRPRSGSHGPTSPTSLGSSPTPPTRGICTSGGARSNRNRHLLRLPTSRLRGEPDYEKQRGQERRHQAHSSAQRRTGEGGATAAALSPTMATTRPMSRTCDRGNHPQERRAFPDLESPLAHLIAQPLRLPPAFPERCSALPLRRDVPGPACRAGMDPPRQPGPACTVPPFDYPHGGPCVFRRQERLLRAGLHGRSS
jgi:hypothetical protein